MPWWRVFPWNPAASDGAPFSTRYEPPAGTQTGGRFDVGTPSVLYLAESPVHAVAELLQGFRGMKLTPTHLVRADPGDPDAFHPLALVEAQLPAGVEANLPDLTDPAVLVRLGIRPDHLASHDRAVTQAISRRVYASATAYPGLLVVSTHGRVARGRALPGSRAAGRDRLYRA
jgi:RES domain-containing protein